MGVGLLPCSNYSKVCHVEEEVGLSLCVQRQKKDVWVQALGRQSLVLRDVNISRTPPWGTEQRLASMQVMEVGRQAWHCVPAHL